MPAEKVLVFSSECLAPLAGKFPGGLCRGWQDAHDALGAILDADLQFLARPFAEKSPQYRQLIPYAVFLSGEYPGARVFTYRRSPEGGEGRLHGMRSLGVGGHVNPVDGATGFAALFRGIERELREEVGFCPPAPDRWFQAPFAVIADDRDEVGRVHCGVVYLLKVRESDLRPSDSALASPEWLPLTDLAGKKGEFEGWSRLVIEALESEGVATDRGGECEGVDVDVDVDLAEEGHDDVGADPSAL